MKIRNNKGFVMIETIIVMSILALGLISLYTSYVLIMKRTQNSNSDSATNTYIAYQINNYKIYEYASNIDTPYYVEIYRLGNYYLKRDCGILGEAITCSESTVLDTEEINIFLNLNIEKIYYITRTLRDVFDDNIILLFDGSTINYLNKIKNDVYINNSAERTVIVKTKENSETKFSFYQQETNYETKNIRRILLGENNSNVSNAVTVPGISLSNASENVIATTMDDSGLSYYYRGNVQNNYLVFANMCWRIVRITGNGSIKLVLYNANDDSCNINSSSFAFAKYNNVSSTTVFNLNSAYNSYIGYMYSDKANSNDYSENHLNNKDSTILTRLKGWYDNKFSNNEKKLLADVIWCNDKRVVASVSYNPNGLQNLRGTGVKNDASYYQTSMRINPYTSSNPTLSCGGGDNAISKFTSFSNLKGYKIGLLTADEVVFAGSNANASGTNNTYYLYQNAQSNRYWTISPAYFNGSNAFMWIVNRNGVLTTTNVNDDSIALRPAIALLPSVNVIGSGTANDPYIVIE